MSLAKRRKAGCRRAGLCVAATAAALCLSPALAEEQQQGQAAALAGPTAAAAAASAAPNPVATEPRPVAMYPNIYLHGFAMYPASQDAPVLPLAIETPTLPFGSLVGAAAAPAAPAAGYAVLGAPGGWHAASVPADTAYGPYPIGPAGLGVQPQTYAAYLPPPAGLAAGYLVPPAPAQAPIAPAPLPRRAAVGQAAPLLGVSGTAAQDARRPMPSMVIQPLPGHRPYLFMRPETQYPVMPAGIGPGTPMPNWLGPGRWTPGMYWGIPSARLAGTAWQGWHPAAAPPPPVIDTTGLPGAGRTVAQQPVICMVKPKDPTVDHDIAVIADSDAICTAIGGRAAESEREAVAAAPKA